MFDLRCDISVTDENPTCAKCWTSEKSRKCWITVDAVDLNWMCVALEHRTASRPPSLLLMSRDLLHDLLAPVLARNRTSHFRVVFVCTYTQYPPEFCRRFVQAAGASAPHGAQATARDPAWRWTAVVLAATTQQVGPHLCPPRCPDTLSIDGNSLSTRGASEDIGNAPAWTQVANGKRARDHDLFTSELNVLNNRSKNMKRKQHQASRHSVNNLPETMLTKAEMNSVGPATRQSYTTAHATLDRALVRYLGAELFAQTESAAVARLALFGTISCRESRAIPTL